MTPGLHDTPPDLPVLDTDSAIRNVGGTELYAELAEEFLRDLPDLRTRLQARASRPDAQSMIAEIHELANSFGVIGAMRGDAAVRRLELRLRRGVPTTPIEALRIVAGALEPATRALGAWLASR
jgi:HPt (histidine-containing phosphotransfer) domain-containing protein